MTKQYPAYVKDALRRWCFDNNGRIWGAGDDRHATAIIGGVWYTARVVGDYGLCVRSVDGEITGRECNHD
jgi:hypothetical protein